MRQPRHFLRLPNGRLAVALLSLALLSACGGSGSPEAAGDLSVPLDGSPVASDKRLRGHWMAITDGELDGIEFLDDGQALLSRPGSTLSMAFRVLDGGRLSLADGYGRTSMFGTQLAGAVLELSPEGRNAPQRFRRLDQGETLAEAMQAFEQQRMAEMERRYQALQGLIAKGGTVLVSDREMGLGPWQMSLMPDHPDQRQSFLDSGWLAIDTATQKDPYDPLAPVRVLPFRGQGSPVGRRSNELALSLTLGAATEPAGDDKGAGRIELKVGGPLDKPVITGMAHLPSLYPSAVPVTLRRDGKVHDAVNDKLQRQREFIAAAIQGLRDVLGGRSSYSGQRTELSRDGQTQDLSVVLEYDADTKRYHATLSIGPRTDSSARADIQMLLGEAVLYVVSAWGEQWRLGAGEAEGQLTGFWRPNTRSDFLSHGAVRLQQTQRISEEQLSRERAAVERFIAQDLRTPRTFSGFMTVDHGRRTEQWPIWLELQTAGDGSSSGRAWLLAQAQGMALEGRVSGRSFTLRSTQAMPGSTGRAMRQNWQFDLATVAPVPTLRGTLSASTGMSGGSGPIELKAVTTATEAYRTDILKALDGRSFRVLDARSPEPSDFRFRTDPASGKITGEVVGADLTGRHPSALPPGLISGDWIDEHGFGLLKLVVDGSPSPAYGGRESERFEYTLAVTERDEAVMRLQGWNSSPGGTNWLRLESVPAAEAIEISQEQRIRLAAQRLGARVNLPRSIEPGDEWLLLVQADERDARVGQFHHADGRYTGTSIARAALHAGVMRVGEMAVLRLRYGTPFTTPVTADEHNGITAQRGHFKPGNKTPSFTIERVDTE